MVAFHGIHCLVGLVRVCWRLKNLPLVSMIGRDSSLFSSFFAGEDRNGFVQPSDKLQQGIQRCFFPSPRDDMMCQLTASYIATFHWIPWNSHSTITNQYSQEPIWPLGLWIGRIGRKLPRRHPIWKIWKLDAAKGRCPKTRRCWGSFPEEMIESRRWFSGNG